MFFEYPPMGGAWLRFEVAATSVSPPASNTIFGSSTLILSDRRRAVYKAGVLEASRSHKEESMTVRISMGVVCLILMASCAHTVDRARSARGSQSSDLASSAQSIAADVAALRALVEQSPLKVRVVDNAAFAKAFHGKTKKTLTSKSLARERALWIAFGFASSDLDPNQIVNGVLNEQVLGFYDQFSHVLYVRKELPKSLTGSGADGAQSILAHEIEHALQDQHFGFPDLRALSDDDTRLARASLFEGDATVVMAAYVAQKAGKPLKEALLRAIKTMRSLPTEAMIQMSGHSPALLSAPAIFREGLIFPYLSGMGFVSALYRAGGFQLVNKLFSHPPNSTEQVLHPEKYLAGEPPIPVTTPAVPAGYRMVASGRFGELGARVLLSQCLPRRVAQTSAAGWGGDSFVIAEAPDKSLALLWSTVWDDEAHATQFERGLRAQPKCWKEAVGISKQWSVSNINVIRREGAKVAFVRGLPAADAGTAVTALLGLPQSAIASVPPLGTVAIPPEEQLPEESLASRGSVEQRVYTNERFKLRAEIPEGFEASTTIPQAELVLQRKTPPKAMAMFTFMPAPPSMELQEQFFMGMAASIGASLGGGRKLVQDAGGDVDVGWAKGKDRIWKLEGTPLRVRGLVVPGCGNKASFGFAEMWLDAPTRGVLDQWIASFNVTDPNPAPGCVEMSAVAAPSQ
jgi:hypothetical protein